uniref:Aminotransferase class I/classII large domain-containing protein n=1 Tax=Magallana gigas TaxID=29159 RepID=K1QIP9_MAGGI
MFRKVSAHSDYADNTDDDGIDPDVFERLLQETPAPTETKYPFRRMLFVMTVHHNPMGSCLPPEKCRRLVSLARKYDVLLFAEDVYNLLTYTEDGVPPPRLLAYDNKEEPDYRGHTISNCTFSKIFSPGMRLGWIETSPRIIQMLRDCIVTGGGHPTCPRHVLCPGCLCTDRGLLHGWNK